VCNGRMCIGFLWWVTRSIHTRTLPFKTIARNKWSLGEIKFARCGMLFWASILACYYEGFEDPEGCSCLSLIIRVMRGPHEVQCSISSCSRTAYFRQHRLWSIKIIPTYVMKREMSVFNLITDTGIWLCPY